MCAKWGSLNSPNYMLSQKKQVLFLPTVQIETPGEAKQTLVFPDCLFVLIVFRLYLKLGISLLHCYMGRFMHIILVRCGITLSLTVT
jgi:hypothetical protein